MTEPLQIRCCEELGYAAAVMRQRAQVGNAWPASWSADWPPAVAMAVADWLVIGANPYACNIDINSMIAVARAYLGRPADAVYLFDHQVRDERLVADVRQVVEKAIAARLPGTPLGALVLSVRGGRIVGTVYVHVNSRGNAAAATDALTAAGYRVEPDIVLGVDGHGSAFTVTLAPASGGSGEYDHDFEPAYVVVGPTGRVATQFCGHVYPVDEDRISFCTRTVEHPVHVKVATA